MSELEAKKLLEERGNIVHQMKEKAAQVASENRTFTAEENETWAKWDARQKECKDRADTLSKIEAIPVIEEVRSSSSKSMFQSAVTKKDWNNTLRGFFKRDKFSGDEYRHSADKCGVNLFSNEFRLSYGSEAPKSLAEARAAQTITTSGGGYTIQSGPMQALEVALLAYGGMNERVKRIRTNGDGSIPIPTMDDTGNKGAILAINTAASEQALTFGQQTLGAYKYTSKYVTIPNELFEDTAIDLVGTVTDALAERLARIENEHMTTGDGTGKPRGFMIDAVQGGATTASATAVTALEVMALLRSVDPAYRNAPPGDVGLMCNDNSVGALERLVDSTGRPLWEPSLVLGEPDRFKGYPIYINQDMDDIEADAKPFAFGNFRKYLKRDVRDVVIKRFDEINGLADQVVFVAFSRWDGRLIFNSGKLPVKYLLMKSA